MKNLSNFFSPKSIAVVGASPKKNKVGNILLRNIKEGGWQGKIYPVNPKHAKIGELKCYASLTAIKDPIDLVLIAIPAPLVSAVLKDGSAAKPKIENYVVISAGFKEAGKAGVKLENELIISAAKRRLNVLGPNCLGFLNPASNLNASFTRAQLKKGKVGIISQSGALAVALLDWAEEKQIGFSKIISIGNKAVIDESAMLEYLGRDSLTKAIAVYVEDIKEGLRFKSACEKLKCKKPVVIIKAGKTSAGQRAVSSHTGSLAQNEAVIEAVFEKMNAFQAETLEEFQDMVFFLSLDPVPNSKECIVVTNAGGMGVLAADDIGQSRNIKLLKIKDSAKKELRKFLPASSSVENPIDILGDADPSRYEETLAVLAKHYPENSIVAILTPQSQTKPLAAAKIIIGFRKKFRILVTAFSGGTKIKTAVALLNANGIANFESPERALDAIDKVSGVCLSDTARIGKAASKLSQKQNKENTALNAAIREKRALLSWRETEKIFRPYGIKLADAISCEADDSVTKRVPRAFFPCVLKTDDASIAHRWEKKAVAKGIRDDKQLLAAWRKMKRATGAKHFLVQPMFPLGMEIIVGMKRDSSFGPVIVVGWGGTYTETFKDMVILIPPFTKSEILKKLKQLKIFPILDGTRGEKPYNLDSLMRTILGVQKIALKHPVISEIDINPLFLYNNNRSSQIVDAKIFISLSGIKN